jgi:hypothetical protein
MAQPNQQHYLVDWVLNHDAIFENVTIVSQWILITDAWDDAGVWTEDGVWPS